MKIKQLLTIITLLFSAPISVMASEYLIDTEGAHAAIEFRIQHLGYSWLLGQFKDFSGTFNYDEKNPAAATFKVTINTASIDSNHAERDKHLREENYLDTDKYPQATFISSSYTPQAEGRAILKGKLTLHGVTREISIAVAEVGAGMDPWGGYRRGFTGETTLVLADFGIDEKEKLGPAAKKVKLFLFIEGIRQLSADERNWRLNL